MAVNLTLGFQDQYSAGFQQMTAEMEKQEQAANKLTGATQQHNESLRQMAKQHDDVTRAMITGKQATGSLVVPMSKLKEETKGFALSGEQARQAAGFLGGSLAGMPPKVLAVVLAFKALQKGYEFLTKNETVNSHLKDTANNLFGLEKAWKQLKKESQPGIDDFWKARDAMLGMSTESRKLSEELEKQADAWKHLKELRGNYDQEKKAAEEFREFQKILTKEAADDAIRAQQDIVTAVNTSEKSTADQKKKANERLIALEKRRDEIETELQQKRIESARKAAEREVEIRRNAAEKEKQIRQQQLEYETKLREEAAEKQRRISEAIADGEKSAMEQHLSQNRDFWKQRLGAHEGNAEKIVELERDTAKKQHELAVQNAKSEEEVIQANYDLERQLRDIDFQHEMNTEAKKIDAAKKAADAKVQAERDKIERIKALTDKEGKNLFQQQMGKQSPQAVAEEIARRRFEEARKERPGMGREAQTRLMRGMRAQTMRDLQGGKVDPSEIQQVQADLASNQILAGQKQGVFSQETMKSFAEQAKAFQEQARFNEEMANQQREFQQFMRQARGETQGQAERARAQRRGVRG